MIDSRTAAFAALLALGALPAAAQPELRLGAVDIKVGTSATVEYDDNLNGSDLLKESDVILRAAVRVTARMDVTQYNYLELDAEVGYRKYVDNSALDDFDFNLGLTPGAGLRWNIKVGPVKVTLRDALSFSTEGRESLSYDQPTGTVGRANAEYRRFENLAGVDVGLDVREGEALVFVERSDEIPLEDDFDYLAQTVTRLGAEVSLPLRSDLKGGLRATWEDRSVDDPVLNDATRWAFGPVFTWQATDLVTVEGTIRYASFDFATGGIVADNSDESGIDVELAVRQVLSKSFSHGLSVGDVAEYGQLSNSRRTFRVAYDAEFTGLRFGVLYGTLYVEDAEDSGGLGAEQADTEGLSLGLRSAAESGLNWLAEYGHERRDSSDAVRKATRNRFLVGVNYGF